ncbi:MAG: 50S ribosomal protein L11 [Nanobdellota archaeon]
MAKEKVEAQIEGGKATAAPPLGPALGPMGVNIGNVVSDINKKTQDFKGMQVPVTVTVDTESKDYEITIGTPPASALIKQEAGVQKGAQNPLTEKVGNLEFDQILKITNMKSDNLLGKDKKEKVKEILGSCQSVGITIDGEIAHDIIDKVKKGEYDEKL